MDPIQKLLSISDYQEFLEQMLTYTGIDKEDMKTKWRAKWRAPKPAATVTNRTVSATTKKVVTETSKTTTLDD